jgi:hypothetical protein
LPVLLATYPSLFHYANNAHIVIFSSLERTLLLYSIIAFIFYVVFFCVMNGQATKAANASVVFLIFFNLYGIIYDYLYQQDVIQVYDFTLLPLVLLLAFYASLLITKVNPERFWRISIFFLGVLIAFNVFKIIPIEIAKHTTLNQEKAIAAEVVNESGESEYPDIYFIIFDEFAGFNSMRKYWNYQGVDDFGNFLRSKGFFVAEESHGSSIFTLEQMSERLNYQEYPSGKEYYSLYYDAVTNNRVMQYLKSLGYTTVVFDEKRFGFPAIPNMTADQSFEYDSINAPASTTNLGSLFDDFGILVAENTMLRAFPLSSNKLLDPAFIKHQHMIYFTAGKISELDDVPSPKFVHAHLLLPHYPFMFSESGALNEPIDYYNWKYYLGNYKFTIKLAEKMVNDILQNANPAQPPIIILQSDHGVRNILVTARNGLQLENFPEEYKTDILNALYLPGYDTSQLSQDMNPINTFPIIFNHYFHTNIPLAK